MTIARRNYGDNHGYTIDGVKTPGVTTILRVAPKEALVYWAAKASAECVINEWDELSGLQPIERYDRVRTAHTRDRDAAARKGTVLHKLAEQWQAGQEPEPPELLAGHYASYLDFRKRVPFRTVAAELVLGNRTVGYCGTCDVVADMPPVTVDGMRLPAARWILDLKTSRSGIWPESALQVTAYMRSETYLWGEDEYPVADLGITYGGAVHIRADGWDLRPLETGDDVWDYFCHLAALYRAKDPDERKLGPPSSWVGFAIDPDPTEAVAS